jgi:protein involved in polysaccharide export with SLBB domain
MNSTVQRPGFYYLPQGAIVRDAVKAAKGLSDFTWWRSYSGIERPRPDGLFNVFVFSDNRDAEELILLQDGDRIYFGHEVY